MTQHDRHDANNAPNNANGPVPQAGAPENMTFDAAVEHMILDAQLVAHAQAYDRASYLRETRQNEVAQVLVQIAMQFDERSQAALKMLGVTMAYEDDALAFCLHDETFRVLPLPDGKILAGDRQVTLAQRIYSDALYDDIMRRVIAWALAIEGNRKCVWST